MGVIFNGIYQLGNVNLVVIQNSEVAVLQGFGYCESLCNFNPDQGFWPLYNYIADGCCSGVAVKRGSTVVYIMISVN